MSFQQYNTHNLQPTYGHHGSRTGSNGLVVGSACWPTPSTGLDTEKFKAWLDKPTFSDDPNAAIKNKHVAGGVALLGLVGLAWYGHKHRWF